MRTTIPIFIAGPTDMTEARKQLKEVASELNAEHKRMGHDITVVPYSFENFDNHQKDINDFVENKADAVLFVLDHSMAKGTEEEFRIAAKKYESVKRPEFLVLLKKYESKTQEISNIEKVLNEHKTYYSLYSDQTHLRSLMKDFVDQLINKRISNSFNESINNSKRALGIHRLLALLASIVALALIGIGAYKYFKKEPMLVFSGGGSVANFLHQNPLNGDTINLRDYPNSIYINQASGSAWALLVEEANRFDEKKFCSICLSADRIDSTFMNEKNKTIFQKARIIELIIGHDPLAVYIDRQLASTALGIDTNVRESSITPQQLCELITSRNDKDRMARLFSTSKTSGTLRTYQYYISEIDSTIQLEKLYDETECFLFYDKSSSDYMYSLDIENNNKPFIALGSHYYYPEELTNEFTKLFLTKDNDTITKPICIYFIAKKDENNNRWIVNSQITDFLRKIKGENLIDKTIWKGIEQSYIGSKKGQQIININDTTTWIYKKEQKRLRLLPSSIGKK